MEAKLTKIKKDYHVIEWSDKDGFGNITIQWDDVLGKYIVDSELLGVKTMIKIIKSIK